MKSMKDRYKIIPFIMYVHGRMDLQTEVWADAFWVIGHSRLAGGGTVLEFPISFLSFFFTYEKECCLTFL